MEITNNYNLPEPVFNAIKRDDHKGADYSASMLYKSPRMVQLGKRHEKEITKDAITMVWALLGTALHGVLEKGTTQNDLTEAYMEAEVAGKILSGASDLLVQIGEDEYKISDYRMTSVFTIIYQSSIVEWQKQLNTYAYLFRKYGFNVTQIEIVTFLRDWKKREAKFKPDYPQSQILILPIKLWSLEYQHKYIESRIKLFESFNDVPDHELPPCTDHERWKDPAKYAVMKKGAKKAARVLNSESEAAEYMANKGYGDKTHFIEHRPSEARKCEDYCDCNQFCNQYCMERDKLKG